MRGRQEGRHLHKKELHFAPYSVAAREGGSRRKMFFQNVVLFSLSPFQVIARLFLREGKGGGEKVVEEA